MRVFLKKSLSVFAMVAGCGCAFADSVLFEQNFEALAAGPMPKEFLALAGEFMVVEQGGGKVLNLPGAPLDTFGAMFGPSSGEPGTVSARFFGTKQGRKYPTFGLSLRGAGGYRLQVSPGKGQLEFYKGDEPLVGVPFQWESGSWMNLRMVLRKGEAGWVVEGFAWKEGSPEPGQPLVKWSLTSEPSAGRAAIWGSPFSGTPIQFDDIRWSTP